MSMQRGPGCERRTFWGGESFPDDDPGGVHSNTARKLIVNIL